VQKNDRVPTANGDVTHLAVADVYATTSMIVFGGNPVWHGIVPPAIGGAGVLEPVAILEINTLQAIRFSTSTSSSVPVV
jgi:hypothetical protein